MAQVAVDFYDDPDRQILTKISMPRALAGAPMDVLSEERRARLSDSDFGLILITKQAGVHRKFPVHDSAHAWLSAQYFDANYEKLSFPARLIAGKFIKEACRAYEVPASPGVDAYARTAESEPIVHNRFAEGSETGWMLAKLARAELQSRPSVAAELDARTAMPNGHFALVVQTGDGEVIRKYAMPDAGYVKKAAAYFDKYAMQLAPEHRHRFASSVKARATELGVALGDTAALDKWASPTWNAHVRAHLEQRKSLLPTNDRARQILDKLASFIGQTEPETMAEALATFDEATNLTRYYDRGLSDAFASTMGKVASAWSAEIDGHTLTEADLKTVATTRVASYLGEGFAKELAAHPVEAFESLPKSEQVLIAQIAGGLA